MLSFEWSIEPVALAALLSTRSCDAVELELEAILGTGTPARLVLPALEVVAAEGDATRVRIACSDRGHLVIGRIPARVVVACGAPGADEPDVLAIAPRAELRVGRARLIVPVRLPAAALPLGLRASPEERHPTEPAHVQPVCA
jgi:hypothetical protein